MRTFLLHVFKDIESSLIQKTIAQLAHQADPNNENGGKGSLIR